MMDPALEAALSGKDVDADILRAIRHVDFTIRKFIWSGFRPTKFDDGSELTVAGLSASDFVDIALHRLITGVRAYDASKTFVQNINRTTDSIVWSAKKSSDRDPTVAYRLEFDESGLPIDPITLSGDSGPSPADLAVSEDLANEHGKLIENFKNSFDGANDIQDYIEAMAADITSDDEIAEYVGVTVERLKEIRKLLKKEIKKFFGVKNYRDLERKIGGEQ